MDKCLNTSGEELTANSKFLKLYFFSHIFPGFLLHFSNITEFTFCLNKFFLHTTSFDKKNIKCQIKCSKQRHQSIYALLHAYHKNLEESLIFSVQIRWFYKSICLPKQLGMVGSVFKPFHSQVMAFIVAPYNNDLSIHYNESLWTIRPLSSF